MECFFESFGLPTADFIKSFKETFPGPKSLIALSPDAGADRLRKIHKGHPYTNQALMDCLDQLERHGVTVMSSSPLVFPSKRQRTSSRPFSSKRRFGSVTPM